MPQENESASLRIERLEKAIERLEYGQQIAKRAISQNVEGMAKWRHDFHLRHIQLAEAQSRAEKEVAKLVERQDRLDVEPRYAEGTEAGAQKWEKKKISPPGEPIPITSGTVAAPAQAGGASMHELPQSPIEILAHLTPHLSGDEVKVLACLMCDARKSPRLTCTMCANRLMSFSGLDREAAYAAVSSLVKKELLQHKPPTKSRSDQYVVLALIAFTFNKAAGKSILFSVSAEQLGIRGYVHGPRAV